MHAYYHNLKCQMKCNPKNIFGISNEDGEDSERLWSSISSVASQTSVMRNETREDFLTIICEGLNEIKLFDIVKFFGNDIKRCKRNIQEIFGKVSENQIESFDIVSRKLIRFKTEAANINPIAGQSPRDIFLKNVKISLRRFRQLKTSLRRIDKNVEQLNDGLMNQDSFWKEIEQILLIMYNLNEIIKSLDSKIKKQFFV